MSKTKTALNLSVCEQGQDKAEYLIHLDGERVGSYSVTMADREVTSTKHIFAELEIRVTLIDENFRNDFTLRQDRTFNAQSYSACKDEISEYVIQFVRHMLNTNPIVKVK